MRKAIKKRVIPKRKSAPKKAEVKTKVREKKATRRRTAAVALNKRVRSERQSVDTVAFALEGMAARSGGQSGDLQGLSNVQNADSESVDELLEEGNAFEADAVKGVEDAEEADAEEVHTHEVPQDDVPGEYLDRKK
jgi:N utilization substance protein A